MNYEEKNRKTQDAQDAQLDEVRVDEALRHFRSSVQAWSEQEFGRARTVRRSRWDAMLRMAVNPVLSWTMVGLVAAASVAIPVSVHHEREVAAERRLAVEQIEQQQRAAVEAAKLQEASAIQASAINDDELMSHVDSDVAQAAPDAMEPLASLMSDTTAAQ
jgi:hypothetical protein